MQGFVSKPHTAIPETLAAVTVLKAAFKAALKSDGKIQLCFHCCYTCLPLSKHFLPLWIQLKWRNVNVNQLRSGDWSRVSEINCIRTCVSKPLPAAPEARDWQTAAPCFHFEAREEECQYDGTWFCKDSAGQICAWTSRLSFERKTCFATQPLSGGSWKELSTTVTTDFFWTGNWVVYNWSRRKTVSQFACLFPWARCFFSISAWALTLI